MIHSAVILQSISYKKYTIAMSKQIAIENIAVEIDHRIVASITEKIIGCICNKPSSAKHYNAVLEDIAELLDSKFN